MVNTREVFAGKNTIHGVMPASVTSAAFAGAQTVFAENSGGGASAANSALSSVFGGVKDLVGAIFRWIGYMLLIWGVAMLILAFKNEDADSKSRAMMLIGVGAALTAIDAFITMVVKI